MSDGLPTPEKWNAAVEHSWANPTHTLGPYFGDSEVEVDCNNCDFDTAESGRAADTGEAQ